MPKTYTELAAEIARDREKARCRREFKILTAHDLSLVDCEANYGILIGYFEPDTEAFDHLSATTAIENDEALRNRLAWQNDEQREQRLANEKADLVKTLNAKPITELRAEYTAGVKNLAQHYEQGNGKPQIPATLTRAAFIAASREQAREWVNLYGSNRLNEHWARQQWETVNG
jgi:hypothetical protein